MTNVEIIMRESIELAKAGILKFTGRVFQYQLESGEVVELPEVEPIHTYAEWKRLGYQVKRGEKAKACFPIWHFKVSKPAPDTDDSDDSAPVSGKCHMNKAFWFTAEQVEKIA